MHKKDEEKIQRYIEELGEEYKVLLFEQLVANSNTLEGLSVSQLLKIDEDVKKYLRTRNNNRKYYRYSFVGRFYVFVGVSTYLLFSIINSFNELKSLASIELLQLMSIVVTLVGVWFYAIPSIFRNNRIRINIHSKSDDYERKIVEYSVISKWRELEGLSHDISLEKSDNQQSKPAIQFLADEGVVSGEEMKSLRNLLQKRNIIVHDRNAEIPIEELRKDLEESNKIIDKIKSKMF